MPQQLGLFGEGLPPRDDVRREGLKIATWNVNGIRARHEEVLAWIEREQPDVVCLQEIKAGADKVPGPLTDALGNYRAHWHGHKGYSGVALLLRRARFGDATFTHPPFDMEHRIVTAACDPLVLASVYVPNGGKDFKAKLKFLRELVAWATELRAAGKQLILCGDLNVARTDLDVHPTEVRHVIGQLPVERALIEELLAQGLVDVLRHTHPDDDRLFTWWAPWREMRARNIGWRLDYVCAAASLVDETVHCVAYRDVGTSDHGPVIAHLRDATA